MDLEGRIQGVGRVRDWNHRTESVAVSNLLGAGAAITAGYFASRATSSQSPEVTSLIATVADISAYYSAFILSNGWFNRRERLQEDGKYKWTKVAGFVSEKLTQNIAIDKVYAPVRAFAQYELDKRGVAPQDAALMIQGTATAILTVVWPIAQYLTTAGKTIVTDLYRKIIRNRSDQ